MDWLTHTRTNFVRNDYVQMRIAVDATNLVLDSNITSNKWEKKINQETKEKQRK